jgi:hypothetical protein
MIAYLLSVARERPLEPPTILTDPVPASFATDLFHAMADNTDGITRHGTDAMMDALFALPGTELLLQHPFESQKEVADAIGLPELSATFRAHWTHIIVPAWNQHSIMRKIMRESQ